MSKRLETPFIQELTDFTNDKKELLQAAKNLNDTTSRKIELDRITKDFGKNEQPIKSVQVIKDRDVINKKMLDFYDKLMKH